MVTITQKINPNMIILAREARGVSQQELAEYLKVSQANLSKMEQGFINVNEGLIKGLQNHLSLPENFFYQQGELLPPNFSYRKRDKVAQRVLTTVDANINMYRIEAEKLLNVIQFNKANVPSLDLEKYETPESVARQLRKLWKVHRGPVENLTKVLEDHNILVVCFDFGTARVDGRSIITSDGHPIVFANKQQLGDRHRFTLAYELGHLVMHLIKPKGFQIDVSHQANQFAAEFLMPKEDIIKDLQVPITIQLLAELKKKWKVSMQAIMYRAADLNLLSDNQKRYLVQQFNQLKIRRREPAELDIPKEQPVLLRSLITQYKNKQRLSVKSMAEFFNLSEEEFM
ncbi:MAG: XRE family transcriptional regulator, partial [Chitinophagaceae bacterium]